MQIKEKNSKNEKRWYKDTLMVSSEKYLIQAPKESCRAYLFFLKIIYAKPWPIGMEAYLIFDVAQCSKKKLI